MTTSPKCWRKKCGEFTHGFTYSGHPTCAAVAVENIRIMREEKIIERVQNDTAPYFQQQWAALAEHSLVGNVRGIGMVAGLELATADGKPYGASVGAQCRDLSIANGLVMRSIGDAMIVAPPLVISKAQIDELITKVRKSLDELTGKLGL